MVSHKNAHKSQNALANPYVLFVLLCGLSYMHELSIALSMIEMASDEVVRHGGARVAALHLKLGQLSGVVQEALTFSWEIACQGTALEGSQLIIEETEGRELEVVALELEEVEELVT